MKNGRIKLDSMINLLNLQKKNFSPFLLYFMPLEPDIFNIVKNFRAIRNAKLLKSSIEVYLLLSKVTHFVVVR